MAVITNISNGRVVVIDLTNQEYELAPDEDVTIDNARLSVTSFQTGVDRGWIEVTGYIPPGGGLDPETVRELEN